MAEVVSTGVSHMCDNSTVRVKEDSLIRFSTFDSINLQESCTSIKARIL